MKFPWSYWLLSRLGFCMRDSEERPVPNPHRPGCSVQVELERVQLAPGVHELSQADRDKVRDFTLIVQEAVRRIEQRNSLTHG